MQRRNFLKTAAGAGIGAIVTGCAKDVQKPAGRLLLCQLGRTDIQLTPVGFGAQHTRDSDLIRYAIDQGINYIETAWAYGFGKPGNSSEAVGKAIAGIRDKVYLFVAYVGKARPTSKAWVANQFEQTLRDLGTDYIDVFLWHQPETIEEITKEHIDIMQKWKSEGKIRFCGVTSHENQEVFLKHLVDSSLYDVAVVAFNYNSSQELAQSMKESSQKGVGIIAMKTQSPNYNLPQHTLGDAPDHRKALSWVLSKNYLAGAIPGMTTKEQVDMNIEVMKNL